jgi:hypothetical protein
MKYLTFSYLEAQCAVEHKGPGADLHLQDADQVAMRAGYYLDLHGALWGLLLIRVLCLGLGILAFVAVVVLRLTTST